MGKKVEITTEHREWLKANYAQLSNRKCREHIGCGYERLKEVLLELGMTFKSDIPSVRQKAQRCHDQEAGNYCMDCEYYKTGGECRKTGRSIGALWQKQCFAHRITEPVVVRVETSTTKRCKICGEVKHFTEFWKHPKTKSFTKICQACTNEAKRKGAKAMHESKRSKGREANPPHS